MKELNYAIKLSKIIYCQNLSDWDQFMEYLQESDYFETKARKKAAI